jgi:hypothetical protein
MDGPEDGARTDPGKEHDMNTRNVLGVGATLVALAASNVALGQAAKPRPPRPMTAMLEPQHEATMTTGRNRFFILEPGDQRVFQGKEDGKTVDLVITVLDETKQVAGVQTRVVEERESVDGVLVEVSRNYFALGMQSHTAYYFGEDVDMYKNGKVTSHEGSWQAGFQLAKHGIAMPAENTVGVRYYQEQAPRVAMDRGETVSLTETVTTPAGTFANCLKVKETTPLEPANVEYKYYAPETGLVQDGTLKLIRRGVVKGAK